MKSIIMNPISIWLVKLIKAKLCEFKNRKKNLKIGYMSYAQKSKFGKLNKIKNNVTLNNVVLDDFTYVSSDTKIQNAKIGKFCSIGANCRIGLGMHPSRDFVSTHPVFFSQLQESQITFANKNYFVEFSNITLGNDVWIGTNSIILDGVTVSDGAIIGAGSVVTKDIPPYAIVGGVPAKIIRYRFDIEEINKLLLDKWWDKDIDFLKKNFKKFHNIKKYEFEF